MGILKILKNLFKSTEKDFIPDEGKSNNSSDTRGWDSQATHVESRNTQGGNDDVLHARMKDMQPEGPKYLEYSVQEKTNEGYSEIDNRMGTNNTKSWD